MIQCPICQLLLNESNKDYSCKNHHHFDKSKNGYTNLFLSHAKRVHGDNDSMIHARHRFLNEGHYSFLLNQLIKIFNQYSFTSCVDLGCGEGYYTNHLSKQFTNIQFIGLDLSKTALRLASKASNVKYFCASIAHTPLMSASVDCVLCIFAPFKLDEIRRILKPNGYFITVNPMPNHLYELKDSLYDTVKLNPKFELISEVFNHIESYEIKHQLSLNNPDSIHDLLDMTPYRYKAKESSINAFYQLKTLTTECSFQVDLYKFIN
jgi:23S rRNA (guanine745-N1)-methyltransferase